MCNVHSTIKDKSDIETVEQIIAVGYPHNISYLDELLSRTCDPNWPVAGKIYQYFISLGVSEVERVKNITSGDTDYWWRHSIPVQIIACYDNATFERFTDGLISIARQADSEEYDIGALRILSERNLVSDHEMAKRAKRNLFAYNLYIKETLNVAENAINKSPLSEHTL